MTVLITAGNVNDSIVFEQVIDAVCATTHRGAHTDDPELLAPRPRARPCGGLEGDLGVADEMITSRGFSRRKRSVPT